MSGRPWDVVVIGGGPAGALCATLLGRQGRAVLLLERTLHPTPKVCGEFLGPLGMDQLARAGLADLVRAHGVPVARLALMSGASAVQGPLAQDGVGIRREVLDALLLAQAAAVATVRRGVHVTGLVATGAGWQVLTGHAPIATRLVIGADGRHSRVRAWSGLGVPREPTGRHALAAHARVPGRWEGGEMHVGPLGQLGVCPVAALPAATLVNLNLLLTSTGAEQLRHAAPRRLLVQALRSTASLAGRLRGLPAGLSRVRAAAHLRQRAQQAAGQGVALIGDAAFSCDPITGEGMSLALQDATHLARCLAAAPSTAAALATYAEEHHRGHRRHRAELRLLPVLLERPGLFGAVVATAARLPRADRWLTQRYSPQAGARP